MTTTNHDDQLGEIYPTMLNELNCTFGVSFSRLHCGRHGHGIGPKIRHGRKIENIVTSLCVQSLITIG